MSAHVTMPPKRPALVSASTSSPHSSLHSPLFPPRPRLQTDTKNVSFRRNSFDPPMEQIINETSPLMRPRSSAEFDGLDKVISPLDSDDWQGDDSDETKSTFFLFLLTLGGLGLQIGWSVETSNGSVSWTSLAFFLEPMLMLCSRTYCPWVSASPCSPWSGLLVHCLVPSYSPTLE